MQDLLLLIAVAATFVFGFFVMKRLDRILENNYSTIHTCPQSVPGSLKIGFSDPLAADSIVDILEKYSGQYPGISIALFSGTGNELLRELSVQKLDVVFLPEGISTVSDTRYHFKKLFLKHSSVITKYGGLPIEPITGECLLQNAFWLKTEKRLPVSQFIGCLQERFSLPGQ